jgi:indolepyruvate ferredoxin oxidoreductase
VLVNAVSSSNAHSIDATTLAASCLGDAAWANVLLLGYAYQLGLIPVSAAAIERAIEINGVAIEQNKRAFAVGRLACYDFSRLKSVATPWWSVSDTPQTLEEAIKQGVSYLEKYQNHAYARRYRDFVAEVQVTEQLKTPGKDELTRAVARGLLKLMAYKDEYEVARLLIDEHFRRPGVRGSSDAQISFGAAFFGTAQSNDK